MIRVSLYLRESDWKTFKKICNANDVSASRLVRKFIKGIIRGSADIHKYNV